MAIWLVLSLAIPGLFLFSSATTDTVKIRIPPTILTPREPKALIYSSGQAVEVSCNATGTPKPTYKWQWNGGEISGKFITYNATGGQLDISPLSDREEGLFVCFATTTFDNKQYAMAMSAPVEIRVARVGEFPKRSTQYYTVAKGKYVKLPCDKNLPVHYGSTAFKWYKVLGADTQNEISMNDRIFIDQEGSLHFSCAQTGDESGGNTKYRCAMSNVESSVIKLGGDNELQMSDINASVPDSHPEIQYTTSSALLTVEVGRNATLECVFSGYESNNSKQTVPTITWLHQNVQPIDAGGRYAISNQGRSLVIINVTEDDEKTYHCRGDNSLGSAIGNLTLNVTSRPIWVHRIQSRTLVEGQEAQFTCITRPAPGEQSPNEPIWSINGDKMGSTYDPGIYLFNANKTILTIKGVSRDRDIACYQCNVANSVGMVQDGGCVNVVSAINIAVKPAEKQKVKKGDLVDLTFVATVDPLYAKEINYSWIFKNVIYAGSNAPPNVTYEPFNNHRAYINTSVLNEAEFAEILGIYRRIIRTPVEERYFDVVVEQIKEETVSQVETAEFDLWPIFLALGIAILLIALTVIIYTSCRRKKQEGTYLVDKKETAAGLDPEKELLDSGFRDFSNY